MDRSELDQSDMDRSDSGERRLAERLTEARLAGTPVVVDDLPAVSIPGDCAAAYRVQDLVASSLAQPVLGWKIGCTSEHAQHMLGASGPFPGRVFTLHRTLGEPVDLDAATLRGECYLEGEFAFTLGADLPAPDEADHGTPNERGAVLGAVRTVHPAIEVVGGRYDRFSNMPLNLIIADAGSNRALILGPGTPLVTEGADTPSGVDPNSLIASAATMRVDGSLTGSGTGADVLGDPVEALVWLVDELHCRGISLRAGQVITTGTATQVTRLQPGQTATVTIADLGSATVRSS